jgi:hypothetical protein
MTTVIDELATYHEVPRSQIEITRDYQDFICYSVGGQQHSTVNLSKSRNHIRKNTIRVDRWA